ncbi:vWA domain-containing protein [Actinomadura opuntiae]|uniref:vWA domain-containing protein n=1 Tax=Actinomadura sp. OS1-43 TaxID=604315 RepID=UPI00255B213B|nr:vWA domain-containing protein [Actinomadura sp. OS1-43]MDL4819108.1 vWA domain-containing protein [Actinomadura sp. OS1-43]
MSSEGGPDRRSRGRQELTVLGFAVALFCAFLGVYGGRLLSLPWWGQALFIAGAVGAFFGAVAVMTTGGSGVWAKVKIVLAQVVGVVKWSWPGIVGAAVVISGVVLVPPLVTANGECGKPVDLRVVTDAENVAPLAAAAQRYVTEKSEHGCRRVTVDVAGDAPTDEVKNGFARGWTSPGIDLNDGDCTSLPARATLLGSQPDVWIPADRTVAEGVRQYSEGGGTCSAKQNPLRAKADLDIGGSVGTSPVVVGVFGDADRQDLAGDQGRQSLTALLHVFSADQVLNSVARPSPDTSDSALLATPVLHQALRSGWAGGDREPVEKILDQSRISAGDAASMLCAFRDDDAAGKNPPGDVAVIVPEDLLARYDHGDVLGTGCRSGPPSQKWRLFPYYTADLPALDHPFVHVRWPGEDTARRDEAVAAFRKWLDGGELAREGLRTVSGKLAAGNGVVRSLRDGHVVPDAMPPHHLRGDAGCVGSLQEVKDCYADARPAYPLSLLVDVSGSMANPVTKGGPRLGRAQDLALRIVGDVRPTAPTSLFLFSAVTRPETGPIASSGNEATRPDVQAAIQRAVTNGRDLALTTAIEQAAGRLHRGKQTLVVLTDGQAAATNRDGAAQARGLAGRLRADKPGLRLLIVPTGPGDCGAEPVASIAATFGPGSCIGRPQAAVEDLVSLVMADVFWG